MDFLGSPNIQKLAAEHDLDGLYQCLEHRDLAVRLQAAQALAELNDLAGWQFLYKSVGDAKDPDSQMIAADMLGELGNPRAIPALEEALIKAAGEPAQSMKAALETIGGQEADEALRRAGYEPILPHMEGAVVTDYDARYVRPVLPDTSKVEFLTAEQHLNTAVELREAEQTERGLVENSLALWLRPEWAYAWYIRGVLFEDLDRNFEASLCYRWAADLDPQLQEARSALEDLESEYIFPSLEPEPLLAALNSQGWTDRRDAAAGLGELGQAALDAGAVDVLIKRLEDDEREVRHAVIEALGNLEDSRAVLPLVDHNETSWLLRFSVIEALSQLGSLDGLVEVLRKEMNQLQQGNPVFSSNKDPLLEVEYDRLMEIGVLTMEHTGDLETLLAIAEDNALVDEDEDTLEMEGDELLQEEWPENTDLAVEDEDLELYVDEVALMVSLALERLAAAHMSELSIDTLQRLSEVPDLMLIDISGQGEDEEEPGDEDALNDLAERETEDLPEEEAELAEEAVLIHDLGPLREAARLELLRRK